MKKAKKAKNNRSASPPSPAMENAESIDYTLHIQSVFDSMPRSYQKIARYLLDNPDSVRNMSITRLSRRIGICISTITRFSQFLGFSGYSHLKYDIIRSPKLPIQQEEVITSSDGAAAIIHKLRRLYAHNIENVANLMNSADLDFVANVVARAKKIYLFGHGGSGVSVNLGQILFMQIGLPAVGFTEVSTAAMAAAQMGEEDVAFGISSSGMAKTAVDSLQRAQASGAITVGITGFAHSPLATYSRVLFCYNFSQEDLRLMHIARICEAGILGMLQNSILNRHFERLSASLPQAKEAFMSVRY